MESPPALQDLLGQQMALVPLIAGLQATQTGICVCDDLDHIRYVNDAFRIAFFPQLPLDQPSNFVEAMAGAIRLGKGIKLETMTLDEFVARSAILRSTGPDINDFNVDLADGSWWRVNDRKLSNGWMLIVAVEISSLKNEEFRLQRAHADALEAAQTDFLTGLPNRRHGMELAERTLREHQRARIPLAIAVMDIDHFKQINDAFGHDVGDQALMRFADALRDELTSDDHACRLGGEEFLWLMGGSSLENASRRLHRLMFELSSRIPATDHEPPFISFSTGLVATSHSEQLKSVLARADEALYAAKKAGRNRIIARYFEHAA